MTSVFIEKRNSNRRLCSDPIWWKAAGEDRFQQGWLIERSPGGAAFLARGSHPLPPRATWLRVCTTDPAETASQEQEAFVSRIDHVHADLSLIVTRVSPSNS